VPPGGPSPARRGSATRDAALVPSMRRRQRCTARRRLYLAALGRPCLVPAAWPALQHPHAPALVTFAMACSRPARAPPGPTLPGRRHIARKLELYGASIADAAVIDMVLDGVEVGRGLPMSPLAAAGSAPGAPASCGPRPPHGSRRPLAKWPLPRSLPLVAILGDQAKVPGAYLPGPAGGRLRARLMCTAAAAVLRRPCPAWAGRAHAGIVPAVPG
jgi:hypothetical protein